MRFRVALLVAALFGVLLLAPVAITQPEADCDGNNVPDAEETRPALFDSPRTIAAIADPLPPALGDFDGDGDLDLVVTTPDAVSVTLLRNLGGGYVDASELAITPPVHQFRPLDLEGDGDLDLVGVSTSPARLVFLTNQGDMSFVASFTTRIDPSEYVLPGDVDGDGDPDLVLKTISFGVVIFENQGAGQFTRAGTVAGLESAGSIALADANGDGDLDILAIDTEALLLFANDGSGAFTPSGTFTASLPPIFLAVGDLDGDADVDAAITTLVDETVVLRNDGHGAFAEDGGVRGARYSVPLITDLDNDQRGDVVLFNGQIDPLVVLHANEHGGFDFPRFYDAVADYASPGDTDGDGLVDLVLVDCRHNRLRLARGDGAGGLIAPRDFKVGRLFGEAVVTDLAAADLDGDGRPDLVGASGDLSILMNLGDGDFAPVERITASIPLGVLGTGDVDGDGDVDVVAGDTDSGRLVVFENDRGSLHEVRTLAVLPPLTQLLLVDVDGDDIVDLVAHSQLAVLRNRGDGAFESPAYYGEGITPRFVVAADFDSDRDIDLAAGTLTYEGGFRLLINDGAGRFTVRDETLITGGRNASGLIALDVNGDRHLDRVFVDDQSTIWALKNRGNATFLQPVTSPGPGRGQPATADLDADGDLDLLVPIQGVSFVANRGDGHFDARDTYVDDERDFARMMVVAELDGEEPVDVAVIFYGGGRPGHVVVLRGNGEGLATPDCDGNGRPDVCDLADGDCDNDGQPDRCGRDGDGDGVPDACDECPEYDDRSDADGDGTADCHDGCPTDPAKLEPGPCGCHVVEADADTDGVADCADNCRGLSNGDQIDRDGDASGDECDLCPTDPLRIVPEPCGCGGSLFDSDLDGTVDCADRCPRDPFKVLPEPCGCGVREVVGDADGDRVSDCSDNCPAVPNILQTDSDADGIGDGCDPLSAAACFGDCDGDGRIAAREVANAVSLIFGSVPIESCLPFDTDGDGRAQANDLVRIQTRALSCPFAPISAQLNVTHVNFGDHPSVCTFASGGFAVAFALGRDITVQRFDAEGRRSTSSTVSTGVTQGARPAVACMNDGRLMVVWETGSEAFGTDIVGRAYDASARPLGPPTVLNTFFRREQQGPRVATNGTDRYVVAWSGAEDPGPYPSVFDVFARRFDGSGHPLGPEVRANELTTGHQGLAAVAVAPDGGYAVAFDSTTTRLYQPQVMLRVFDANGDTHTNEIRLNGTGSYGYVRGLGVGADGRYRLLWQEIVDLDWAYRLRAVSASGGLVGRARRLEGIPEAALPIFAVDRRGSVASVWTSRRTVGEEGADLVAALYDAQLHFVGSPFVVNDRPRGDVAQPDVAFGDHGVVVAWLVYADRFGVWGIWVKRFDANGVELPTH